MKRTLALVLLLVFSVMSLSAADVSFGGNLGWFMTMDEDDTDRVGNIGKLRLKMSVAADDYNSLYFEMRDDTKGNDYLTWNTAAITTDWSGAMGIDTVGLTTKFGIYEEWLSHWNQASSAHRARVYASTFSYGNDLKAMVKADFGVAAASVLYAPGQGEEAWAMMAFALENGSDFPVEGLNFIGKYVMFNEDAAVYTDVDWFALEAGYDMMAGDVSLKIVGGLLNRSDADQMDLGLGVVAGYDKFSASLETSFYLGDDASNGDTLGVLDLTASYMASDAATLYVKSYNNLGFKAVKRSDADISMMQAIDLGAKYSVGSATFYAGYVVAGADYETNTTQVCDDDNGDRAGVTGSGFYLGVSAGF